MAQITLTFVGRTIGTYGLDRDRLTVGRRPDNDIHIENLAVSGYHAVVLRTDEGYVIEDLNSTNGTFVNDTPIKRHILCPGDVLRIGKHELLYDTKTSDLPLDVVASPPEQTAHPNRDVSVPIAAGDTSGPGAAIRLPPAAIRVLNGSRRGTELRLDHLRTRLGRPGKPSAVIVRDPRGYVFLPTECKEEVFVNDQSPAETGHLLENRDVVEIAGLQVEFYYLDQ